MDALQQACHLYDESLAKLTVLTDATNQKICLTKHLAKECNVEVSVFIVYGFQFSLFVFTGVCLFVFTVLIWFNLFCFDFVFFYLYFLIKNLLRFLKSKIKRTGRQKKKNYG